MWSAKDFPKSLYPNIEYAIQYHEKRLLNDILKETRTLRPDFGRPSLIDWNKVAMDHVEGRE